MINSGNKLISSLLALTVVTPIFCGCNIVTPQNVETSLPTVPEQSTSEVTTTTSETTEETTEPSAEERVILKTPDGTELFNAQTDSFPVKINVNNIFAVSKGTVIVTYTVYIPEEVEDLEGNKTIQQVEAVDEYKYDVTFTDASN